MFRPAVARGLARHWSVNAATAMRWSSHENIPITDVRKGMILHVQGQYWEVKDWQPAKQGRGAASYAVTYDEMDTGKVRTHKFSSGARVTKVEPDKSECEVMYHTGSGIEEKKVVLADIDYNEVELPMTRFHGMTPAQLPEGTKVIIYTDDEAIVKVSVRA